MNLNNLFHNFPIGIVYQNANGEIINANKAAEEILGLSFDQMQGKKSVDPSWKSIKEDGTDFPGEEHPAMVSLRTGKIIKDVVMGVYHAANDDVVWINIHAVPEFKPGGKKPFQVFTTFTDITQSIKNRKQLIESQKRYKALFENSGSAINVLDKEGRFLHVNKLSATNMGGVPSDFVGKNMLEVLDEKTAKEFIGRNKRLIESGEGETYERNYSLPSGDKIFLVTDVILKDTEGIGFTLQSSSIDITELRNLQHQFKNVLDNASEIIFAVDKNYKLILANKAFTTATIRAGGHEIKIGEPIISNDYPSGEIIEKWKANCEKVFNGEFLEFESSIDWDDGTHHFINYLSPLKDNMGKITGAVINSSDITKRNKIFKELQKKEQELDSIISRSNAGTWIWNIQSGETIFNERWANIVGYTLNELSPVSIDTWMNLVHPDDLKKSSKLLESHFNGETPYYECDARMKHKNGHWVWIKDRGSVESYDAEGKPVKMSGIHLDITDMKKAEIAKLESARKLESFIGNLPGIAFRCKNDEHWTMEFMSQQTKKIIGYAPSELIDNNKKHFSDIIHTEDQTYIKKEIETALIKNEPYEFEYRIVRKDGKIIWVSERGSSNNQGSNYEYIEGIIIDVSSRKNFERNLIQSEARFRNLFENHDAVKLLINPDDGNIVDANKKASEFYGWTIPELKKMNISDINILSESVISNKIYEVNKKGKKHFEFKHRLKNGNVRDVDVYSTKINEGDDEFLYSIIFDITEKKYIQARLTLLSEVIEQSPIAVFITDSEGIISYVNKTFTTYTGYEESEVIGKDPSLFNSGRQDQTFYENLWSTIKNGKIFTATLYNKKKTGETFPIREIISPIQNHEGVITNFVALQQDLSELILAKEKAEESNKRYEMVLQGAAGGIYDWDIVNKKVHFNEGWKAMRGYSGDEFIENEEEWSNGIHHEDKEKLFNALQEHFEKKTEIFEFEYRVKHQSGHYIWVYDRGKAFFNDKGEAVRMAGSEIEITERKKTENELILSKVKLEKNALELLKAQEITKIGSWYLDIKTNLVTWTEELYKMYGFDPTKPVPPYTEHMKLFTPESWQVLSTSLAKTRETGIPYELELRTVRKDNSNGWMWVRGEVVKDENDKTIGLWGAAQDITNSKQIEEELSDAKEKAEESNRLKSAFLATMNHELRTPLNHILGLSDMIPDMTSDESIKEFSKLINESGSHLLAIIEDIFDLAMIDKSEVLIRREEFYIRDIYITLMNEIKDLLNQSNKIEVVKLEFNIDSKIVSTKVKTDKSKILIVVSNLLRNAIKFTHKGFIKLSFHIVEQNNIQIIVADSGIGIPKEKQSVIFDVFRQVDDSHTREYEGIGIGLAISQRIAAIMGGSIEVESEIGVGSIFKFTIPIEIQSEKDILIKQFNEQQETTDNQVFRKNKFLIVEDDNTSMLMIESFLKVTQCDLLFASNGQECCDIYKQHPDIDLILMDIKMPIMDGLEATSKIRNENPDIPIIAMTAYSLLKDKDKALTAGCNDIITKPINKSLLIKKLKSFLK